MKLNRFEIKNFRGINEISINLFDYTSLIGPNNCGNHRFFKH
ncbi:MAG: AAA family ATPase [Fibrobacterota bacterium]|nr:MAG: AAA family ATPase [Fibrobacterota bacterium]